MTIATHFAKPAAANVELTAKQARISIASATPLAVGEKLATNADYAARGYYPVTGDAPSFTANSQYLVRNDNVVDEQEKTITRSWTVTDKTLEQVRAEHLVRLNVEFRARRDAGVYVAGILLETIPQVQAELTTLVARLDRVGGTQRISTRSGFVGEVDLATATTLHNGVEDYISAVWQNDADKAAAINAAETVQAVLAVDVTAGWPSRNEPE